MGIRPGIRKVFNIFMLLILFISSIWNLKGLSLAQAQTTSESKQIVSNEYVDVDVEAVLSEKTITWTVRTEKKHTANQVSRMKLKFADDVTVASTAFDLENTWWVEKEYSSNNPNTLHFETPIEQNSLQISVQMDIKSITSETLTSTQNESVALEAVTENILTEKEEGPHTVTIDRPEVMETTTSVPTTTTTVSAAPEISTSQTTTTSAPATTEQTTTTDEEVEESSEIPPSTVQPFARNIQARLAISDPFQYTDATNLTGIYPVHGTNKYLVNGTSNNIKNYAYDSTSSTKMDDVMLFNVMAASSTFDNAYHEYENKDHDANGVYEHANTKMTVAPTTADPNIFKVQLDTIGDAIRPYQPVDIVLVVDKSGSMTETVSGTSQTKWQQLKSAVSNFSTAMLATNPQVRFGLVSFNSTGGNVGDIESEMAQFNGTGFTSSATTLNGSSLLSGTPTGGTPTFIGVDVGLKLLMTTSAPYGARANAQKVIVTITDGVPTFSPKSSYYSARNLDSSLTLLDLSLSNTSKITFSAGNNAATYFSGDGTADAGNVGTTRTETINYLAKRYSENSGAFNSVKKIAIGYDTQDSVLQKIGTDGVYLASNTSSLVTALNAAMSEMIYTIAKATLNNPLSQYVTLLTGTNYPVTEQALHVKNNVLTVGAKTAFDFSNRIVKTQAATGFQFSELNLGEDASGRQGYRVSYFVELKSEYRDGTFYPTNTMTHLVSSKKESTVVNGSVVETISQVPMYYAIPSVRVAAQTIGVSVQKKWTDQNNKWGLQQGIRLQLQSSLDASTWQDVSNAYVEIPAGSIDTALTHQWNDLPAYKSGQKINYRVVERVKNGDVWEENNVAGYDVPVYTPTTVNLDSTLKKITVENKLLTTSFKFKKVLSDSSAFENVTFKLFNQNNQEIAQSISSVDGEVSFSDLPIGTYHVKESVPVGFLPQADFTVTIKQDPTTKKLLVSGLPENAQIMNRLKPIGLTVYKYNARTKTPLAEAVFKIYSGDN